MSSWLGTSLSSCHQASMLSCCVHHLIHLAHLCREGSGIEVCWRLSPAPTSVICVSSPSRNSWMQGSRGGGTQVHLLWSGPVRWVTCSLFIPQVGRWGSSVLASFLGLSSNVTHCLNHKGLGDLGLPSC